MNRAFGRCDKAATPALRSRFLALGCVLDRFSQEIRLDKQKITKKAELCAFLTRQKGCKSSRHAYNLGIKQVGRLSSASASGGIELKDAALADGGRFNSHASADVLA